MKSGCHAVSSGQGADLAIALVHLSNIFTALLPGKVIDFILGSNSANDTIHHRVQLVIWRARLEKQTATYLIPRESNCSQDHS
jgi:hypothetical protein